MSDDGIGAGAAVDASPTGSVQGTVDAHLIHQLQTFAGGNSPDANAISAGELGSILMRLYELDRVGDDEIQDAIQRNPNMEILVDKLDTLRAFLRRIYNGVTQRMSVADGSGQSSQHGGSDQSSKRKRKDLWPGTSMRL